MLSQAAYKNPDPLLIQKLKTLGYSERTDLTKDNPDTGFRMVVFEHLDGTLVISYAGTWEPIDWWTGNIKQGCADLLTSEQYVEGIFWASAIKTNLAKGKKSE